MRFEFAAVKGRQGGREYYLASVPMSALSRFLQIDVGDPLERSQREVDVKRAEGVMKYCSDNPTSFVLPSLTGAVEDESLDFISDNGFTGLLSLSMDAVVKLFDGQHRATAIMGISRRRELKDIYENSTIGIQLFVGMSLTERQQAFSDINSTAKAVSKSLNLAYDRRSSQTEMLTTVARTLFLNKIDFEKNIATKGSDKLFSFKHFVDASRHFFNLKAKDQLKSEQVDILFEWFQPLPPNLGWRDSGLFPATDLITQTALGLMAITKACRYARGIDLEPKFFAGCLQNIDFSRKSHLWRGVCVDGKDRMIVNQQAIKDTAVVILEQCGYVLNVFDKDKL